MQSPDHADIVYRASRNRSFYKVVRFRTIFLKWQTCSQCFLASGSAKEWLEAKTQTTHAHTHKKNQIWDQLLPITEPQAEGKGYAESDVGRRRKRHLQSMHCKHKHARPRPYTTRAHSNIRLSLCAARHNNHSASRQMLSLALIRTIGRGSKTENQEKRHQRWNQTDKTQMAAKTRPFGTKDPINGHWAFFKTFLLTFFFFFTFYGIFFL